ncbi:MAG: TRAP transporter small permease [Geminicoccaceae bacterium]|nr:TRAP transporter small permease [Geminicoccaceae bacterium]MCS7268100.1 TRAP transporter small permease [Geminicoccaceae bacterium]MCX7629645.1 TRAP transporter small permease [Geminicoccaceae bacterium]MDW8125490.1 TRAP transporter small permease subunit [Geminicoccaceae bacterium]MDW8342579.1 TRAP transporter small permease subunit [Geminicoccaceae bacterium]
MLERSAAAFAIAGGTVLLAIAAITGVNVLLYLADLLAPGRLGIVRGYEDLVRLFVSAAVPMLFPYCQLRRGHVAVDLLAEHLPPPVRLGLERTGVALTAAIALFLAFWLAQGLLESRADGRIAGVLGWPEWPFFLPGLLSLLLWAAIAADQLRGGRR